ncbi:MAG: portal protein [Candidatus Marinimicrobia bacterium]|nr:portal protein [Candidatus Neomarinimicrobiota bacterium]
MWETKTLYDRLALMLNEKINSYSRLKNDRELIAEYFRLDLQVEVDSKTNSLILGRGIYEGTAPWAARIMATGFQGKLMSKSIDWIAYTMSETSLIGIDPLDIWVQQVKEYMTDVYQRGNFYDVQPNFTLDGLTVGSPVMFAEEDLRTKRIMWIPQYYKHCYLFYNKFNEVEGIIIKDPKWTVKQIYDKFTTQGKSGAERLAECKEKFSACLYKKIEQGMFSDEHTIIRAVFYGNDPVWDRPEFKKPIGNPQWISVYYEESPKEDRKDIPLSASPYWSRPFVVWDYNKKPWDVGSSTPAFEAYHDTLSHQQVHKNFIELAQKKVNPAMYYLSTMDNRIDFNPGGLMPVEPDEYNHPPRPIEGLGDILLNKELSDIFSAAIKRHFHLDQLQTFLERLRQGRAPLTELETMKLDGESASFLSPFIESHSRYLSACDEVMMGIEVRAAREGGPFAPDVMAEITDIVVQNSKKPVNTISIRPEFIGPLHRSQKLYQKIDPIRTGVAIASEIGQVLGDPELPKIMIRGYETIDDALQAVNFPQKNVRTKDEYEKTLDEITQARLQQQQMEMALQAAKVVPPSKKIEEGSPIAEMAGAV